MTPQQQKALIQRLLMAELDKHRKAVTGHTIRAITIAFAISLHDKFGWEKEDINKLIANAVESFDAISKKYVTLDDFTEWAQEYGIINVC